MSCISLMDRTGGKNEKRTTKMEKRKNRQDGNQPDSGGFSTSLHYCIILQTTRQIFDEFIFSSQSRYSSCRSLWGGLLEEYEFRHPAPNSGVDNPILGRLSSTIIDPITGTPFAWHTPWMWARNLNSGFTCMHVQMLYSSSTRSIVQKDTWGLHVQLFQDCRPAVIRAQSSRFFFWFFFSSAWYCSLIL